MTKSFQMKEQKGLYQSDYEHDACGVGMVVNIHGGKSHDLVDNAPSVHCLPDRDSFRRGC